MIMFLLSVVESGIKNESFHHLLDSILSLDAFGRSKMKVRISR